MDYSFGHRFGINLKLVGNFFSIPKVAVSVKTVFSECYLSILRLFENEFGAEPGDIFPKAPQI